MTTTRRLGSMAVAALLAGSGALAQTSTDEPVPTSEAAEKGWAFYASAYAYFIPDDDDYVVPALTADWDWLHLEARYNYEGLDTASLWVGYNFSVGEKVTFDATAMLGGVYGDTSGVAPGYRATLSWTKLEFYSEGEYLFDTNESSNNFFYAWSELSWAPVDWFRFGLVGQRTKAYQTDRDIQRGLLIGFSAQRVDFTTYVLNPDDPSPTVVVALGVSF